ncbi:MAG: hypothetical protein U5N56_06110 [Candidatus Marinimicrobia bacterium]|nr:hypothetical protein [Candidatus Neomarinimicrobiota bacterium]
MVSSYSLGKFYDRWNADGSCLKDPGEKKKLLKVLNVFEKELDT